VLIDHLDNPRVEKDQHYYHAAHDGLLGLGLKPHLLSDALVHSLFALVSSYRDRIDTRVILPFARWRPFPSGQGGTELEHASAAVPAAQPS